MNPNNLNIFLRGPLNAHLSVLNKLRLGASSQQFRQYYRNVGVNIKQIDADIEMVKKYTIILGLIKLMGPIIEGLYYEHAEYGFDMGVPINSILNGNGVIKIKLIDVQNILTKLIYTITKKYIKDKSVVEDDVIKEVIFFKRLIKDKRYDFGSYVRQIHRQYKQNGSTNVPTKLVNDLQKKRKEIKGYNNYYDDNTHFITTNVDTILPLFNKTTGIKHITNTGVTQFVKKQQLSKNGPINLKYLTNYNGSISDVVKRIVNNRKKINSSNRIPPFENTILNHIFLF